MLDKQKIFKETDTLLVVSIFTLLTTPKETDVLFWLSLYTLNNTYIMQCQLIIQGSIIEGVKGISALIFWVSALKIKLKGENTLCSLRFQC